MDFEVGVQVMTTALSALWNRSSSMPFDEWVEAVSSEVLNSKLGVVRAARQIGAQPAEVFAVLKLATLEREELEEFSNRVPPRTTWLKLADASREEIAECLDALTNRPAGTSPSQILDQHMVANAPTDSWEKVLGLPSSTLHHMYEKSIEYGCLNPRASSALRNFANKRRTGQAFTLPQAQFLKSLLTQLVDAGAISRASRDNDQDMCDQVLDALGRP
jgi:hypothetical protein